MILSLFIESLEEGGASTLLVTTNSVRLSLQRIFLDYLFVYYPFLWDFYLQISFLIDYISFAAKLLNLHMLSYCNFLMLFPIREFRF